MTPKRYRRVRVADIPYPVRIRAARAWNRTEPNELDRLRIAALARNPGDLEALIAA